MYLHFILANVCNSANSHQTAYKDYFTGAHHFELLFQNTLYFENKNDSPPWPARI